MHNVLQINCQALDKALKVLVPESILCTDLPACMQAERLERLQNRVTVQYDPADKQHQVRSLHL